MPYKLKGAQKLQAYPIWRMLTADHAGCLW